MHEYKCINCGNVKTSDSDCCCPACGNMMFKTPYNRKEQLLSEIERFISCLEITKANRDDILFEGKDEDDKRFPEYKTIYKYVSKNERTDDFLKCLVEAIEHIKIHFTSSYSKEYTVSYKKIVKEINKFDGVLVEAANIIYPGDYELEPVKFEESKVFYSEEQNKYLWFSADELLDSTKKLAEKLVKFVKTNNIYGNIYKYSTSEKINLKSSDESDYKDRLEKAIETCDDIISKNYIIDITDDGADEIKEMLECIWNNIELILEAPLFNCSYEYLIGSSSASEEEFYNKINSALIIRYQSINDCIDIKSKLACCDEDKLFDIYNQLINIDEFGILVPSGSDLLVAGDSEKKLDKLIGLSGIKESIKKIKAYALANKDSEDLNINMCFLGNPGTGKTEVARYIAGILYENKILPTNKVVEVDRSGLVSQYFGATAEKTRGVIAKAVGGVLFVDEAYALGNSAGFGETDYGKEAIDTLVKAMEDNRGKNCVIFAGYKNEMEKMLSTNPGFKSRIQFMLDFPNYSRNELKQIIELMLKQRQYTTDDPVIEKILDISDIKRKDENFANAREVRNILDQVIMCQNLRVFGTDNKEIGIVDVNKYITDSKINLPTDSSSTTKKILTGDEELDALIGLENVKHTIKKIRAYAKRNQNDPDFNIHMCFTGNPGTGKTEVARILSRILYDAGVLDEAKLVETDSTGMVSSIIGESGPKTLDKINNAMGGVLFIDEAYNIFNTNNGGSSSNGDEAISVLLKEMEDRRGQFCVIMAGYKKEMQDMIDSNPGFESRIQFHIDFPDYSREELREITECFLSKKKYAIDNEALEKVLDVTDYFRQTPNFANARTLRNILDQVIMNQNLRVDESDCDVDERLIIIDDVIEYIEDNKITKPDKKQFGFV